MRLLLVAVMACGGNDARTIDAPFVSDATADTLGMPTADAQPGSVTVTVTELGAPLSGVPVYFQTADSSLVLAIATDAAGTAGAIMDAGGFVTVVHKGDRGTPTLSTFSGVQPGDPLRIDLSPRGPTDAITFEVTVPEAGAGTAAYELYTTCGRGMAPDETFEVTLVGCGAVLDALVVPVDEDMAPNGWLFYSDVTVTDGVPVVLPDASYASQGVRTVELGNVSAAFTSLTVSRVVFAPRGRLFVVTTAAPPTRPEVSVDFAQPVPAGATGLTRANLFADGQLGRHEILDWRPDASFRIADVAQLLLGEYESQGGYDPGAHAITWQQRASTTLADVVRVQMSVDRPDAGSWTWRAIAPSAGTMVALPRLPPGADHFHPLAGDTLVIEELTSAKLPGGYATVRARGFEPFVKLIELRLANTTGQAVLQELATPDL